MKPHLPFLLFMLLAPACGGSGSGESRPTEATFSVSVSPMDKEGGKWDRHDSDGHPDICLCIESDLGKRCYPEDRLLSSKCPDTYKCTFSNIPIPATKFTVRVVDVDALNNETIGQATCDWNETCTVGQAKVKIR